MKKLVFDVTDANTIADSDSVGAFVRSSDGTLIDHKTIAATEWLQVASAMFDSDGNGLTSTAGALDVNVASGTITVEADLDGVYDAGTNPTPDSAGAILHTRAAAPDETNQTFRSTGGAASSDAVVAADVQGADANAFGMLFNGTTWDRARGTSGAMHIADGGNSITVDAVDLDIRNLVFATDTVDASGSVVALDAGTLAALENITVTQGTSPWVVSDAALANSSMVASQNDVTTASEALIASPLASRKYVLVRNEGNRKCYLNGGTATSASFPIYPGELLELRAGASAAISVIADGGTQDMRALELA